MTTTHSRANAHTKSRAARREDGTPLIQPEARVCVATVNTGRFDFVAVGATASDAKAALLAAWDRHRAVYAGADPGYMAEYILQGEVTFHFLPMGGATRDGEAI